MSDSTENTPKVGGYGNPPAPKWKKGDPSPNPRGRPKGSLNTSTIIKRWLEATEKAKNPLTGKEEKMTQMDIITLAQLIKARKGDTTAFRELLDRTDGKPSQAVNVSGPDGGPIEHTFEITLKL